MIFPQNRYDLRNFFFESWQKYVAKENLSPLEEQIVSIIQLHPEYHTLLADKENQDKDYLPEFGETNPFLHMGLHISLLEQLSTNRPAGIVEVFILALPQRAGDEHQVMHEMMEVLSEFVWQMQQQKTVLDEQTYLKALKKRFGIENE